MIIVIYELALFLILGGFFRDLGLERKQVIRAVCQLGRLNLLSLQMIFHLCIFLLFRGLFGELHLA